MKGATRRNKKNSNKKHVYSRKVSLYLRQIQKEMEAGHAMPPKLRIYIMNLIKEDVKNTEDTPENWPVLIERVNR
jgi:hypothetical protein